MKALLFLVFFLAASSLSYANDNLSQSSLEAALEEIQKAPRVYEALIIQKVKGFLDTFDGFHNYTALNISLPNNTFELHGFCENYTVKGFQNATVDQVKFSIIPILFNIHVGFDQIGGVGYYDVDGLFAKLIPIYGFGLFDVNATDISFLVETKLSALNGSLILTSINIDLSVGSVKLDVANLVGGDLGNIITQIIEDNLPEYIRRIMYYYKEDIQNLVIAVANKILDGVNIQDIINWITSTTTAAPATTPSSFK